MRKLLMILLVAISCIFYPLYLYASGDSNKKTETITDETTPEAAKKKDYTNNLILLGTGIMVLGGCSYYILNKEKELTLEVASSHINDDGSLTLTLAYNNPGKEKVKVNENELSVNKGLAIVLEKSDISKLEPGKHKDVMTLVINEDTDLVWNINGKSISINGNDLINKERGLIG